MCPYSGDSYVDGVSPAREDNSVVRLAPTFEVQDHRLGRGPYSEQTHPICCWNFFPPQTKFFFKYSWDYGYTRDQVYSRGLPCLDFALNLPISSSHTSISFLKDVTLLNNLPTTSFTDMALKSFEYA